MMMWRVCAAVLSLAALEALPALGQERSVEQWGMFEVTLKGPADGNPFVDVQVGATFTSGNKSMTVDGFYDGDGNYRVRFMPLTQGEWKYQTTSNRPELTGKTGSFTATAPAAGNHGPVYVARTFHFEYGDGTPYWELGTTCYAWTHEKDPVEEQTLATLKDSPFNKVRMCILQTRFPSHRELYAYQGKGPTDWDFTKFNPEFWQHLDKRVGDLEKLNIQADLILYHPYEYKTGFNGKNADGYGIDQAGDERYLKYIVARLGAYRNVWWSMANEYDLMGKNTPGKRDDAYWDKLCQIVDKADPYDHLLSVHFSNHIYNNTRPWITHASIQNGSAVEGFGRANLYKDVYNKPIVLDEVRYEGDVPERWGRLTGEEMTAAFWYGLIDGTYVGHGDTFGGDQANWISIGGKLVGTSPARLAFLKKVLESAPAGGIDPIDKWQDVHTAGRMGEYYLYYFGRESPKEWVFDLPSRGLAGGRGGAGGPPQMKVEILDTWNMTVTPVEGTFAPYVLPGQANRYRVHAHKAGGDSQEDAKIALPGKPYLALRITAVR